MSGSIGGNRIPKSAVQKTVDKYIDTVLSGVAGFKSAKITGSYNSDKSKKDFGDIDLAVYIEGGDRELKQVKKDLASYIDSQPDEVTVPFRSGKNKGKKSQMYGQIVTCQVPIEGFEGLLVQVDNMVVLSEKDQEYQQNFLDLDAGKQALLMGLTRVILQEESQELAFERLGIKKLPELNDNQEFEFVLSGSGLSLRKVTVEDFKEVDRQEIWRSSDWQDVVKLLKGFDLDQDFDHLLADISEKVKSGRSRRRIVGIMNSMINVGVGEKGTAKGDAKERAINAATDKLGVLAEVEEEPRNAVALYAGGFKPPHKAHYEIAKKLLAKTDRLIIFISSKVREGVPITAEQSRDIWEIYAKYLGKTVETRISETSPVLDIYKLISDPEHKDIQFIIGQSQEDVSTNKWKSYNKNPGKYPNVKLKTLPNVMKGDEKFSASTLRKSRDYIKAGKWIPQDLNGADASKVIDIALREVNAEIIREDMKNAQKQVLEGLAGTSTMPSAVVSSEDRAKLSHLYEKLQQTLGGSFNVQFTNAYILIKTKYPGEMDNFDFDKAVNNQGPTYQAHGIMEAQSEDETRDEEFDYVPYLADFVSFLKEQGEKIEPLPEILVSKEKQSGGLLDKTGDYNPTDKVLKVYANGRHPKDVVRSFGHEIMHHAQCLEGRLGNITTDMMSESEDLKELELEATDKGYSYFREWTEQIQSGKRKI